MCGLLTIVYIFIFNFFKMCLCSIFKFNKKKLNGFFSFNITKNIFLKNNKCVRVLYLNLTKKIKEKKCGTARIRDVYNELHYVTQ